MRLALSSTSSASAISKWKSLAPCVVGTRVWPGIRGSLAPATSTQPSFGDVLLRDFSFYSSALLEPDPKMYWSHASCTINANSNQQPCKATQGFGVATDPGMSQSKLILFGCSHTLFCSPLPQYRHSSHHMLTRESSLATLCVPSATSTLLPNLVCCSFQFPLTLPFLTCLLPAPLVRPFVPHEWNWNTV